MATINELVREMDMEAATTRRVLDRVPEEQLAWKPHEKSMSLGQLAMHVARLFGGMGQMATRSTFDINTAIPIAPATSREELLATFDESLGRARAAIGGMNDADLALPFSMVDGEKVLMTMPRAAVVRTLLLNHVYHHRGQLTVYLRLNDVPVPSVYGPTADESFFG